MNLHAVRAIYAFEMARARRTLMQSIISPVISTSLYFVVFGAAIGSRIQEVGGISYGAFIVPGLIMLSLLTQSIANASFGIYFPRFTGTIYELLSAPVSYFEIVVSYVGAAASKSIILGLIILATAGLFVPLHVAHPFWMLLFLVLTAVTFSLLGFIIGIWADGFEKLQLVPLLIITPLTFLGGSFYSIDMLPPFWQKVTLFNPVVYLISGFRWSFYEIADVNVGVSLAMTLVFMTISLAIVAWIFRTGYRLKIIWAVDATSVVSAVRRRPCARRHRRGLVLHRVAHRRHAAHAPCGAAWACIAASPGPPSRLRPAGRHRVAMIVETRLRRRGDGRAAVIHRRQARPIAGGVLFVLLLDGGRRRPLAAGPRPGRRGRLHACSAGAAVVADPSRRRVVDRRVIGVVHVGDIDVVHRAVVVERAAVPVAAVVAVTGVAEAVVHAAVIADARTPVAGVPEIQAVAPAPVAGRPQRALERRKDPRSRHPVVADGSIGPVTRRPDVARPRRERLHVDGQRRGRDGDGNEHLRM